MHLDGRGVAVISGFEQDDFVAGADHRRHRGVNAVGGTGHHGDFLFDVVLDFVQRFDFRGDGFAQRGDAGHRRILVQSGVDVFGDQRTQFRCAVEIGKAL